MREKNIRAAEKQGRRVTGWSAMQTTSSAWGQVLDLCPIVLPEYLVDDIKLNLLTAGRRHRLWGVQRRSAAGIREGVKRGTQGASRHQFALVVINPWQLVRSPGTAIQGL